MPELEIVLFSGPEEVNDENPNSHKLEDGIDAIISYKTDNDTEESDE